MTDAELVRQSLDGRPSSYEVLVRRWSARVVAYLRSKVRADVAEDLAQEALLRAYRALPMLSDPEKFGAWLLGISHRLALDWLKAKAQTEVKFVDLPREGDRPIVDWPAGCAGPAELCEQDDEQQAILRGVAALPEPLREVVLLYYYDDVTYRQLADMLGVSVATINARLTKARALLREQMRESTQTP